MCKGTLDHFFFARKECQKYGHTSSISKDESVDAKPITIYAENSQKGKRNSGERAGRYEACMAFRFWVVVAIALATHAVLDVESAKAKAPTFKPTKSPTGYPTLKPSRHPRCEPWIPSFLNLAHCFSVRVEGGSA